MSGNNEVERKISVQEVVQLKSRLGFEENNKLL
jgi:hypothetical protein